MIEVKDLSQAKRVITLMEVRIAELERQRGKLLEALENCRQILEQADCSTGWCCCGSPVEGHSFGCGHSPVDEGDYYQGKILEQTNSAIAEVRGEK